MTRATNESEVRSRCLSAGLVLSIVLVSALRSLSAEETLRVRPKDSSEASAASMVNEALGQRMKLMADEARELLVNAVSTAPNFAPAHWQLGEIKRDGRWSSVRELQRIAAENDDLVEYARQREIAGRKAAAIPLGYSTDVAIPDDAPEYVRQPHSTVRYLRKSFEIDGKPRWAQLRVDVIGNCQVYLNAQPVLDSKLTHTVGVEKVTGKLRPGKNVIALEIYSQYPKQVFGLRVCLEGIDHEQKIFSVLSDDSWKVATTKLDGWRTVQFDDDNWEMAISALEMRSSDGLDTASAVSPSLEAALARWCQEHALFEQSRFHWTRLLQVQPDNQEAIKALGLVQHGGRLIAKSRLEEVIKSERDTVQAAAHWSPILQKIQADLDRGTPKGRETARQRLETVDLRAIPTFQRLLAESANRGGSPAFVTAFVELVLARFRESTSTAILVEVAREHPDPSTRNAAIEALTGRDLLSFVPGLMGSMQGLLEVQTSILPNDRSIDCVAKFFRAGISEDEEQIETFRYEPDGTGDTPQIARDRAEAKQREIEDDVAEKNRPIFARNQRIIAILRRVADTDQGDLPASWWKWWGNYNELLMPTQNPVRHTEQFDTEYVRSVQRSQLWYKDCFAKGTPVWTQSGIRAIETIQAGDAVLAQDVNTGELAFKVVLATSIRPSSPMIGARIGDETIISTRGHRYWSDGEGWRMAKTLKPGAVLHGLEKPLNLDAIDESADQPAWNLVVDEFNSYFVGRQGILVHDTGAPRPTLCTVPGLGQ